MLRVLSYIMWHVYAHQVQHRQYAAALYTQVFKGNQNVPSLPILASALAWREREWQRESCIFQICINFHVVSLCWPVLPQRLGKHLHRHCQLWWARFAFMHTGARCALLTRCWLSIFICLPQVNSAREASLE
jgi:hypothetical protein